MSEEKSFVSPTQKPVRKAGRPRIKKESEKHLEAAVKQIDDFTESCKELTFDRMNKAPTKETEDQLKQSNRQLQDSKYMYLRPDKTIGNNQKFNEKFRSQYEFDKQLVYFTAENFECIGETIELWTRPWGGMPAEFWKVPVNKPVCGPRYLAERIAGCKYHRLVMEQVPTEQTGVGTMYGKLVADTTIHRLNAKPVVQGRSVFMGA